MKTQLALFALLFAAHAAAQGTAPAGMIRIPAGPFTMGSADGLADERPAHRVALPDFFIDRLPVTNRQYAEFLNAINAPDGRGQGLYDSDDGDARIKKGPKGWVVDAGVDQNPVVEPSWQGAREYCRWAGGKRLPTEAEWEKAARGSDGRKFPWGNALPDRTRAHFTAGWREFIPVGSLPAGASPYGALDLAGNGWEWTSSVYRPYPYDATDGRESPNATGERVTRGGGQDSNANHLTTTYRGQGLSRNPGSGHHNIGFRCALDAKS